MTGQEARSAASTLRCAVCGLPIENESDATPIGGVYGKGFRHADNAICAEQLRGVDPYAD